jgi:cation diffusion facilitator family transporter
MVDSRSLARSSATMNDHDAPALGPTVAEHASRSRAALLSLLIGILMLVLKMSAYVMTGSATILSDALESVVHVVAISFMFWCFHLTSAPPDEDHPYGHGRAEPLSIGFEGGMMAIAALAIAWEAITGLWYGHRPEHLGSGLWLVAVAAAINLALGLHLLRTGRRTRSALLVADGQHVLSDVWTSLGVLLGIGMMMLAPNNHYAIWIDGLVAILIAGYVLYAASVLIRSSIAALLDEADPALLQCIIDAVAEIREPEWLDVHNLRCRTSGDYVYVDFHLTVPAEWTIEEGHNAIDRLEHQVLQRLGRQGSVLVHLDYPHHGDHTPMSLATVVPQPLTVELARRNKGL